MIKKIIKKLGVRLYDWICQTNPVKMRFKVKGENVDIERGGSIFNPECIELGNHIYIGPECYFAGVGGIKIHDNVIIGPRVSIHTSNHRYEEAYCLPYDGVSFKRPVVIESNVWIGGHVMIVPGVKIGEGAVIAMGAVVTKDVPKCTVVGGNPAKIIKHRDVNEYEKLKSENKFFMVLKSKGLIRHKYVASLEEAGRVAENEVVIRN